MRLTRRLSILLMISIGVNLFLAGMMVTKWVAAPPMDRTGPFNQRAAFAALDEAHRPAVERIWVESHDKMRDKLRTASELRQTLRRTLAAEEFDAAALERSFLKLRSTMVLLTEDFFATVVEIAETLPHAERKRYFETGFAGGLPFPKSPIDDRRPAPGAERQ